MLVGAGLGVIVLLISQGEPEARRAWAVGLIPVLMGGAYLLTWRLRLRERGAEAAEADRAAGV